MVSLKVIFALVVVIVAVFSETYAKTYGLGDAIVDEQARAKRDHHGGGVTGPVHTFIKTDKHANFKWGVRHHVGHHYG